MNVLSPSILAADFANLGRDIGIVADAGAHYIHIDVMDGHFVPNMSLGFQTIECIRKRCDKVFDVHLMIDKPERYIERFANAGADIITIHYESTDDVRGTLEKIKSLGKKAGLVIKPATPVEVYDEFVDIIDLALIMTVEPGFGGQKFMPDMLAKVRYLDTLKKSGNYTFDIEVDGGVDFTNVCEIMDCGANVFVAGSAVFKGDTAKNTSEFIKLISCGEGE